VRCCDCSVVFVDPMPSVEEKSEIERRAYETDILPETADFFRNCHRDFRDDAVIRSFRDGLAWIGQYRSSGRLLDVGPGTGIFLSLAKTEAGWSPYGIDICPASADKAGQEFDIELDVGDFLRHPYESASFDALAMLDVLEHTVDPAANLARAFELLAPGGILYIAVPNRHSLMTLLLDRWIRAGLPGSGFFMERLYVEPHVYYFTPNALRRALESVGFDIVGLKGGDVHLGRYRLSWLMRLPMEIVLKIGTLIGLSAKILVLARKPKK